MAACGDLVNHAIRHVPRSNPYKKLPHIPPYTITGELYAGATAQGAQPRRALLDAVLYILRQIGIITGNRRYNVLFLIYTLTRTLEFYHCAGSKAERNGKACRRALEVTASVNLHVCTPPLPASVYGAFHGQKYTYRMLHKTTTAARYLGVPIRRLGAIIRHGCEVRARGKHPRRLQGDLLKREGKRARADSGIQRGHTNREIVQMYPMDYPHGYNEAARRQFARHRARLKHAETPPLDLDRTPYRRLEWADLTNYARGQAPAPRPTPSRAPAPAPPPAPLPPRAPPPPDPLPDSETDGEGVSVWFRQLWTKASGGLVPPIDPDPDPDPEHKQQQQQQYKPTTQEQ